MRIGKSRRRKGEEGRSSKRAERAKAFVFKQVGGVAQGIRPVLEKFPWLPVNAKQIEKM